MEIHREEPISLTRRDLLRSAALGAAGLTLGTTFPGQATAADAAKRRPRGGDNPAAAFAIGVEAYIYGYPLVVMGVTRDVITNVPDATTTRSRAPINQLVKGTIPDATYQDVVLPSTSTLYVSCFLDLRQEPMILHLPDMGSRFYLMQVLDAWTNDGIAGPRPAPTFTSLGSRYGTGEGDYAFVGPNWNGNLPSGITQVIKAPTNTVWIIGRIFTTGTDADLDAIYNGLYPQTSLKPLSAYGQTYTPPSGLPIDPTVDMITQPVTQVDNMDACAFFAKLAKEMMSNPPLLPQDAPTVARMEKIGLVPGQPFDCSDLRRPIRKALEEAVHVGQRILSNAPQPGLTSTGWAMPLNLGVYGTQYLLRALIAKRALGANYTEDAVYGGAQQDADGQPLSGDNRYVLHFNAGEFPPVHLDPPSFWSVTLYQLPRETLVDNPSGWNAIGWPQIQGNQYTLNPDGSLDIYIQTDPPTDPARYSNWLAAPSGKEFLLFLRMYWPDMTQIQNGWMPSAVQKL